ncbi:MAG: ATP-dependent helicase, partial [Thermosphaera sp.]
MIVLKTRKWISDEAFREILRIAEYQGGGGGERRFILNPEKAVRNGYSYRDVVELIKEYQLELEGSLDELEAAFQPYTPVLEW